MVIFLKVLYFLELHSEIFSYEMMGHRVGGGEWRGGHGEDKIGSGSLEYGVESQDGHYTWKN